MLLGRDAPAEAPWSDGHVLRAYPKNGQWKTIERYRIPVVGAARWLARGKQLTQTEPGPTHIREEWSLEVQSCEQSGPHYSLDLSMGITCLAHVALAKARQRDAVRANLGIP